MKVGFPSVGSVLTGILSGFLSDLGLDVIEPPPVTEHTIQLGVRHSPDMMCFPYKVTLGSMIELADLGADVLLQYNSGKRGQCRQKQYWRLQAFRLARLGYNCRVMGVTTNSLVRDLSRLSGRSRCWTMQIARERLKELVKEEHLFQIQRSKMYPNIGVIGEVYCCIESGVNRNLYSLIEKYGGHPVHTVGTFDYIRPQIQMLRLFCIKSRYERAASRYFEGVPAGHAMENVSSLLKLVDEGIDGVIHVMPLTCMPECMIEDYVDAICEDNRVSLLRLPLDETNSPANVETRVETFVELTLRRRQSAARN